MFYARTSGIALSCCLWMAAPALAEVHPLANTVSNELGKYHCWEVASQKKKGNNQAVRLWVKTFDNPKANQTASPPEIRLWLFEAPKNKKYPKRDIDVVFSDAAKQKVEHYDAKKNQVVDFSFEGAYLRDGKPIKVFVRGSYHPGKPNDRSDDRISIQVLEKNGSVIEGMIVASEMKDCPPCEALPPGDTAPETQDPVDPTDYNSPP